MEHIGVYIHVPFCDGKCRYCNFFSVCPEYGDMDHFVSVTKELIASWGEETDRSVDTVYFGGGTPSLLGARRLCELLDEIKRRFAILADAEITLEVNPTSTGALDFFALRQCGFNRLSVGLQSSNDRELKLLGRRHSAVDAKRTVRRAQDAGFDNISLDVMLAVPGQTTASLNETLRFCADCGVQHISAYILKIEPGTPFYQERDSLGLFDDDEQADFYEHAVERLKEMGYQQYEISNFAKFGCKSRHNLRYWHDEEFIGIGPSAHSFLSGERFCYPDSFSQYEQHITQYEGAGGGKDEYIMLALRLNEGLIFKNYHERYNEPVSDRMMKAAEILAENGLVQISASSLSLTLRGFLVSNAVIAYLLENT